MRFAVLLALAACTTPEPPTPAPECASPFLTWADADGDHHGAPGTEQETCGELPAGRSLKADDCDDADPTRHPGAPEQCDAIDNDCDEQVDELIADFVLYPDGDGDGFGDPAGEERDCRLREGWVQDGRDCDDTDEAVHPGATEVCDGVDNDCNLFTDEQDAGIDQSTLTTYWRDADGDGYGAKGKGVLACEPPPLHITTPGDCHDGDDTIHPGTLERCGGADEDCDGLVDDDDDNLDPATTSTFWPDQDRDGFGDALAPVERCALPKGHVTNPDDCDDSTDWIRGDTDWIPDFDKDGFGSGAPVAYGCLPPTPDTAPSFLEEDCDDIASDVFPGAPEVCGDGLDQDCDLEDRTCAVTYTVGAQTSAAGGFNFYRGNIFFADEASRLDTFAFHLNLAQSCRVQYMVHRSASANGPWTVLWVDEVKHPAGTALSSSPLIDLELDAGAFYALGAGWANCDGTVFRDPGTNWTGHFAGVGEWVSGVESFFFFYDEAFDMLSTDNAAVWGEISAAEPQ